MSAFLVHSRHCGFLKYDGWAKSPTRAIIFKSRKAARSAAKAAARRFGVGVEVIDAESPPRRFSTRDKQSLRCLAHRREITAEIAKYLAAGVLATNAASHKFGY